MSAPKNFSSIFYWIASITIIALIAIFATYRTWNMWYNSLIPVPYSEQDRSIVDAAIKEAIGPRSSVESTKRTVYPVVVHLDSMTCVGLNPRRGVYGPLRTVCFSDQDGSVVVNRRE